MKQGDVILTPVPQANGELKDRPAIFLKEMPRYRDLLVCGISTQLHQHIENFDEIISPDDVDFKVKWSEIRIPNSTQLSRCITASSRAWLYRFHFRRASQTSIEKVE